MIALAIVVLLLVSYCFWTFLPNRYLKLVAAVLSIAAGIIFLLLHNPAQRPEYLHYFVAVIFGTNLIFCLLARVSKINQLVGIILTSAALIGVAGVYQEGLTTGFWIFLGTGVIYFGICASVMLTWGHLFRATR